jgi:hypothetical protein
MDVKQDLENSLEEKLRQNYSMQQDQAQQSNSESDMSNERLRDMNKKLPSWSLEPPYSFLK